MSSDDLLDALPTAERALLDAAPGGDPRFLGLRDGKRPEDVVRERPARG
ncbi:hypothetical protein ABZ851_14690 [Streptomyces sp. NPDC047049]